MTQAAPRQRNIGLFAGDGKPHTTVDVLVGVTLVLGVLALVTAFFHSLHLLSSWAGLAGIVTGGWGQMISVTTRERVFLVLGLGAAGLGFLLGMAHGGLWGGVIG
ncbi:hypothetical protein SRB5_27850 [Streptomyces sp. RB5]|uniref:Uncharacterized protein n=1 Tax=Streptomyces smaragdinus TaxID=2585196 RepID=A0A7K0CGP6_9ACTN|nr:hypothetical protein [Streptomyces smaragdinus]MQY12649.1 hypothetical protein [Streptomyces smaragdinus]